MKSICIIGRGNVATHLCVAFAGKTEELYNIDSRTLEDLPLDADLYILSVSDDAITEVAKRLPELKGVVAHTSGSTSLDALSSFKGNIGVFYPLMTFSKEAILDYHKIPVFIEASETKTLEVLKNAAQLFTDKVVEMTSAQRLRLHIASIFGCNFVNALWNVSSQLLESDGIPFKYMLPLIEEMVDKLHYMSPSEAQTGPAKRGDFATLKKHEDELASQPELEDIYKQLSQLIINQTENKS